jgi:hypothetical protein
MGLIPRTEKNKKPNSCQVWWYTSVILALRRLRQEDLELEASLDYIESSCFKK